MQACCHLIKGWIPFQIAHTPSLFGLSSCEYTVLCVACQIRHASSSSPWFIKCFRVAYFFSLLEIYLYVICLYLFYSRYWNKAFEMLIKWALENVMNFQALYWNHKVSKIILDLITIGDWTTKWIYIWTLELHTIKFGKISILVFLKWPPAVDFAWYQ